jgi:hypothetical protein
MVADDVQYVLVRVDAFDSDQNVFKLMLMLYNNPPGYIQAGAR